MALEYNDVKRLSKMIEGLQTMIDKVKVSAVDEIGKRLNNRVKKATPVGKSYELKNGKKHTGGHLRRNWKPKPAKLRGGPGSQAVGGLYNIVEYAPYVEFGHRIVRNGKTVGWVPGKHMLATSEAKTSKEMVKIIDIELRKMGFK
ncbi:MAG: HK97 gp10 family phage protein [Abditibacteriota bacterium]|nr:HK97 gp10 family phage protein [Abditibacteriota bacterium]